MNFDDIEAFKLRTCSEGGPVLQLLPPGHADGPSSASPGKVVVGQLEKVISMERTAWYLSLSRSWCVSLSLSSLGGT